MSDQVINMELERKKAQDFLNNCKHGKGWRNVLLLFFSEYSWARRILGGKWELWVHDMGKVNAVVTWHWVEDWSDKFLNSNDHIVAKRVYLKGRSLSSTSALLKGYI